MKKKSNVVFFLLPVRGYLRLHEAFCFMQSSHVVCPCAFREDLFVPRVPHCCQTNWKSKRVLLFAMSLDLHLFIHRQLEEKHLLIYNVFGYVCLMHVKFWNTNSYINVSLFLALSSFPPPFEHQRTWVESSVFNKFSQHEYSCSLSLRECDLYSLKWLMKKLLAASL